MRAPTHRMIAIDIAEKFQMKKEIKRKLKRYSVQPDVKRRKLPEHHNLDYGKERIIEFAYKARKNHLRNNKEETLRFLGWALHFVADIAVPTAKNSNQDTIQDEFNKLELKDSWSCPRSKIKNKQELTSKIQSFIDDMDVRREKYKNKDDYLEALEIVYKNSLFLATAVFLDKTNSNIDVEFNNHLDEIEIKFNKKIERMNKLSEERVNNLKRELEDKKGSFGKVYEEAGSFKKYCMRINRKNDIKKIKNKIQKEHNILKSKIKKLKKVKEERIEEVLLNYNWYRACPSII